MKNLAIFATAVLAAALPGCAALPAGSAQAITEQLAVEYATGKVVEIGKTDAQRTERAKNIHAIAAAIDAVAHGDSSTIAQLQQLATQRIASLNLEPSDALLASGLVAAIVTELQGKVSAGVLQPTDLVVLDQVLGWVEQACAAYSG